MKLLLSTSIVMTAEKESVLSYTRPNGAGEKRGRRGFVTLLEARLETRHHVQIRLPPCRFMLQTRSLGALMALTSSWTPFGPLDFVLRALRALRPCDPRKGDMTWAKTITWIFTITGLNGRCKKCFFSSFILLHTCYNVWAHSSYQHSLWAWPVGFLN